MQCHIPEDQNHPHWNLYDELCNNTLQYGGDNYQAKNVTLTVLFLHLAVKKTAENKVWEYTATVKAVSGTSNRDV